MNAPKAAPKKFAKVSPAGRLNLPVEIRRAVGLENGGTVVIETRDREIRIRAADDTFLKAREFAREVLGGKVTVDDFLKVRRDLWRD